MAASHRNYNSSKDNYSEGGTSLRHKGLIALFLHELLDLPNPRDSHRAVYLNVRKSLFKPYLAYQDALNAVIYALRDLRDPDPIAQSNKILNEMNQTPADILDSLVKRIINTKDLRNRITSKSPRSILHESPKIPSSRRSSKPSRRSPLPTSTHHTRPKEHSRGTPDPYTLEPLKLIAEESSMYVNPAPEKADTTYYRNPPGIVFSISHNTWPNREPHRLDLSRHIAVTKHSSYQWRDVLITPKCPTQDTEWVALYKLRPFYAILELYRIAQSNPNYTKMLSNLLKNKKIRSDIAKVLGTNQHWTLTDWAPRVQPNALEISKEQDGSFSLRDRILYKEPRFSPSQEPGHSPIFGNGCAPGPPPVPIRDYTHMDLYYLDKCVTTYNIQDLQAITHWKLHIMRTWQHRLDSLPLHTPKLYLLYQL